jgi:hypothetical protein
MTASSELGPTNNVLSFKWLKNFNVQARQNDGARPIQSMAKSNMRRVRMTDGCEIQVKAIGKKSDKSLLITHHVTQNLKLPLAIFMICAEFYSSMLAEAVLAT